MSKIPAGIWTFLGVFVIFPSGHMGMVALRNAGLYDGSYWFFWIGALALIVASTKMKPAAQAFSGLIAGLFLWCAIGEVSEAGDLYTEASVWGLVALLMIVMTFRSGTRCDLFVWIQRRFGYPQQERSVSPLRGLAVAFEFFFIVWVTHMLLLTAYHNPAFGGEHGWLTTLLLVLSLVSILPLFYMMYKTRDFATGWGRAIPAVIFMWFSVEILMQWQVIPKPWG